MIPLLRHKQSLVGIDIGSSSVKVLELAQRDSVYHVQGYGSVAFPEDAVTEKEIKKTELVTNALTQAIAEARIGAKHAALAMPSSMVITKVIQMDAKFKESELETQIELDANRHIPYPLDEVNLDFTVLGPNFKDETKIDVLIAASRSDQVDSRVDVVTEAGLTAKVMDVESYAIERVLPLLLEQLPDQGEDKIVGVMNLGSTVSSLTVLEKMSIIYTREEAFGGKQLTEAIRTRFEMTLDQAESAKRSGKLPPEYQEEVFIPFKESIAGQISNSLQFFFSSADMTQIDCLLLAGGSATIEGLCEVVQARLGVPTVVANPFVNMSVASHLNRDELMKNGPSLLIACGLALRSFEQ